MTDWLATDDLTIVLGLILAAVVLLGNLFQPQSLVHPILLGRQSDVDRVRKKGESSVYRNYSTGLVGRLPTRPTRETQVVLDLVRPEIDKKKSLWSVGITNTELKAKVAALGNSFVQTVGLVPKSSNVLLLLNDSFEFLVSELALAKISVPSFTIEKPSLLSPVLESHPPNAIITHSFFVEQVLELILDRHEASHHTIIVVGSVGLPAGLNKLQGQVRIIQWEDLFKSDTKEAELPLIRPEDVFSVSFFQSPDGSLNATQLTHENITAGVASTRALLPLNGAITPSDSIVSAHSLSSAHGKSIAYTALFEGASFTTLESTAVFTLGEKDTPSDRADVEELKRLNRAISIMFLKPNHLSMLTANVLLLSRESWFFNLAWRHKVYALKQGFVSNETLWDKLVFVSPRKQVLGPLSSTLRSVIVSDGLLQASALTPARVALSVFIVNAFQSKLVAGPVLASHPLDLQSFPAPDTKLVPVNPAHMGPPAINVEAKLSGIDEATMESGANPTGELFVRGPCVGKPLSGESSTEGWVRIPQRFSIQSNGTFKIWETSK